MNRAFTFLFSCLGLAFVACEENDRSTTNAVLPAEEVFDEGSWDSEAFQDAAQAQLVAILTVLQTEGDQGAALKPLLVDSERSVMGLLRPPETEGERVFQRDGIEVWRWGSKQDTADRALLEAYKTLAASWPKGATPRVTVKHFNVQRVSQTRMVTDTDFHVFAAGAQDSVQQQAKWRCQWQQQEGESNGAPPLLASIQLLSLEELRSAHGGVGTLFADVTVPLLGELPCYQESLRYDANYWITRLPRLKHRFHHGIGIGNVDADDLEDIYLCQPEGLPNILLSRQADGSVRDIAAAHDLDFKDGTTSALFADFDNDGDQDLAVAFRSPFDIFENVNGQFEPRFSLPHLGQIFSLSAADYDSDGLLDLYICRYQNLDDLGQPKNPIPLHDARNGGANALLKNLGSWKFVDTTEVTGLNVNNDRWTTAAAWEDYDGDGDLDLYVANDYGRNNLYRCDRAADGTLHFIDIADAVGVEDMTTSMGVSWGDPNGDGLPDLYVSNMYSSAGRRITYQKNFKRTVVGSNEAHIEAWRRAAMGNSLFQMNADGSFRHASAAAHVQKGLWAWGTAFADINHDGWEDLLVSNGFVTGPADAPDL